MKINHILYKVDNLKESVAYYQEQGFSVEYGREKKPYNALIYFPEGPYIELIHNMNMSGFVRVLLKVTGAWKFAEGLISQEHADQGFIRLCFECGEEEPDTICDIYKRYNKKTYRLKVKRTDTKGRKLICHTIFPEDANLPFVKTLSGNEKLTHQVRHSNGAQRIAGLEYGVLLTERKLLEELNSDQIMKMKPGRGIAHVLIETDSKEIFEFN